MSDTTPLALWMTRPAFRQWLAEPRGMAAFGPWAYGVGALDGTPLMESGKAAWAERAVREKGFLEVLRKLNDALKGAGVPAWLLKGPSLAYRLYDSPLHRPYGDLEILVAEYRWKDFVRVLETMGAVPGDQGRRSFVLDGIWLHGHRQILPGRGLDGVLRWHSHGGSVPGLDWFRELDSNLLFVYLCGHGAVGHLFSKFHWLVDLDRLARREALDGATIERLAIQLRLRRAVAVSAAVLKRHFQTPLPENIGHAGLVGWGLSHFLQWYLSPERIFRNRARDSRSLYLGLKALLRDRFSEALAYGLSRSVSDEAV